MNVEIGTEAAQFPEKEYINEISVAVYICHSIGLKLQKVSARDRKLSQGNGMTLLMRTFVTCSSGLKLHCCKYSPGR
jgi:hypothetical protein